MSWAARERYHSWLSLQGLFANSCYSATEIAIRRQTMAWMLEGVSRMSVFHPWDSIPFRFEIRRGRMNLFNF
jgi:hypothetical protein